MHGSFIGRTKRYWILALLLIGIGCFIRVILALSGIHGTDILYHLAGAYAVLNGEVLYRDVTYVYPPLYALLQALAIALLGPNLISYKLWPIVFDVGNALLLYKILKDLKSEEVGILALALYFLNPLTFISSAWYGLFDSIPAFLLLSGTYLFLRGRHWTSSVLLGLGTVAKVVPAIVAPLFTLYIYLKRGVLRAITYLAVFTIIILSVEIPFLITAGRAAIEEQLKFHAIRSGEGFSIIRFIFDNTPYATLTSWVIRISIYGIVIYALYSIHTHRVDSVNNAFKVALLVVASFITFNAFLFPHYLIYILPLMLVAFSDKIYSTFKDIVQSAVRRTRGVKIPGISDVLIILLLIIISLVCPVYWKFYNDLTTVLAISLLYNVAAIPLIPLGILKLMKTREPHRDSYLK